MSDLSYLIGYVLLFLLNLQMLLSWSQNPVTHGEESFFGLRVSREAFDGAGRLVLRQYQVRLAAGFLVIEGLNLLKPVQIKLECDQPPGMRHRASSRRSLT